MNVPGQGIVVPFGLGEQLRSRRACAQMRSLARALATRIRINRIKMRAQATSWACIPTE